MICFCLLLFASIPQVKVAIERQYQPSPESIQGVDDMAVAPNGNLYVMDYRSSKIRIWDKNAKFIKSFGQKGSGPGEFDFNTDYIGYYNMTLFQDHIMVMDGIKRVYSLFDFDGTFVKQAPFPTVNSVLYLEANRSSNLIVVRRDYYKEQKLYFDLFASDTKLIRNLVSEKIVRDVPKFRGGNLVGMILTPFGTEPIVFTNPDFDGFIIGMNASPEFDIYDALGKKTKTVHYDLPRPDIYPDFVAEHKERNKNKSKFKEFHYPAKMPYYTFIFPLKDNIYIVTNVSPNGTYRGHVIDGEGQILGKLEYNPGEDSFLDVFYHQLKMAYLDDQEEYVIADIAISP